MKARAFDKLFFRHWDSWVRGKRQHLFVLPVAGGEPRDVTPGDIDGYPTTQTFSMGDDFTFTPDSQAIVYTAPAAKRKKPGARTTTCRALPIAGGTAVNLTEDNPAADSFPQFSPDGKWLAYRAESGRF